MCENEKDKKKSVGRSVLVEKRKWKWGGKKTKKAFRLSFTITESLTYPDFVSHFLTLAQISFFCKKKQLFREKTLWMRRQTTPYCRLCLNRENAKKLFLWRCRRHADIFFFNLLFFLLFLKLRWSREKMGFVANTIQYPPTFFVDASRRVASGRVGSLLLRTSTWVRGKRKAFPSARILPVCLFKNALKRTLRLVRGLYALSEKEIPPYIIGFRVGILSCNLFAFKNIL